MEPQSKKKKKKKKNAHRNQAMLQWWYSFFFCIDICSNIYLNFYILQVTFLCFKFILQISNF